MKKLATMLLALISLSTPAIANDKDINFDVFPVSTEVQIGRIKNLIDRAPNGIYLTVGGERAFREASMFDGIEHLVVFDISPVIIKYNNINIELLKTPNKEAYKKLRWESSFADWQKLSTKLTEADFKWWNENVRSTKGYDLPEKLNRYGHYDRYIKLREKLMEIYPKVAKKFNNYDKAFLKDVTWDDVKQYCSGDNDSLTKTEFDWFTEEKKYPDSCIKKLIMNSSQAMDWGQVIDYKSGNYLFDDKLYKRLHNLVLSDKITVVQMDLTQEKDLALLINKINTLNSKIAILDMNNLYLYGYMGEQKFREALERLLTLGTKDSILILMHNYKDYQCAQFSIYLGFTFENVGYWKKEPFFDAFINEFPSDVLPLMDGKLYEGKDELPFDLAKKSE